MFNRGRARVMLVEEEITLEVQSSKYWKLILKLMEIILVVCTSFIFASPSSNFSLDRSLLRSLHIA